MVTANKIPVPLPIAPEKRKHQINEQFLSPIRHSKSCCPFYPKLFHGIMIVKAISYDFLMQRH